MNVFGFPVISDFTLSYRREEPMTFKSYERARAMQATRPGSILSYKVAVPQPKPTEE